MTDPVTVAIISTTGALIVAGITTIVQLRKSRNANQNAAHTLPSDAATKPDQAQIFISNRPAQQEALSSPSAPPDNAPTKLELVAAARAQKRSVCNCTPTGEIMLLKKRGFGGDHMYECPNCGRREKADVPRHLF